MSTPPNLTQSAFIQFPTFPSSSGSSSPQPERAAPAPASPSARQLRRDRASPALANLLQAATAAPPSPTGAAAAGAIVGEPHGAAERLSQASARSTHLSSVLRRCEPLIAGKPPADAERARAKALANVEHYLNHNDCGAVPPKLKALFTLCDETVEDVQAIGLPHGRPNVFVGNWDSVTDRNWRRPQGYNPKEMAARDYLSQAAMNIHAAMPPAADGLHRLQQIAAASLFTGCATCTGHAATFAAVLAQRCAGLELSDGEDLRIELIGGLRLDGKPVDHECCRVSYSVQGDGGELLRAELICDPWSKTSMPILRGHSRFEGGTPTASVDLKSVRQPAAGLRECLAQADRIYDRLKHDDRLQACMAATRYLAGQAPHGGNFPLEDSYHGLVQRDRLEFAKPGIKLPRQRRPTHVAATASELIRAKSISVKSRQPRDVARVLLEHVDAPAWFKQWTDALALPAGAAVLHDALTHRFEDGVTALGKAIEFGHIGLLEALDSVLQRHDLGGIPAADWRDALLAADSRGKPALARMLKALHRPGALIEGMPAAVLRTFEKLAQRLPPEESGALREAVFGAPGFGHAARATYELATYDALLGMLPQDADEHVRAPLERGRQAADHRRPHAQVAPMPEPSRAED